MAMGWNQFPGKYAHLMYVDGDCLCVHYLPSVPKTFLSLVLNMGFLFVCLLVCLYNRAEKNKSKAKKRRPHVLKIDVEGHDYEVPSALFMFQCAHN